MSETYIQDSIPNNRNKTTCSFPHSFPPRYDVDNNGTIDFDELFQVVTQDLKSEISVNDLQDLYDTLDQDGDGKV